MCHARPVTLSWTLCAALWSYWALEKAMLIPASAPLRWRHMLARRKDRSAVPSSLPRRRPRVWLWLHLHLNSLLKLVAGVQNMGPHTGV